MTTSTATDPLLRYTDGISARPIPEALLAARRDVIQVEKTLVMLGHTPTEVDRLIRLVLAAWGRAESVVYGSADGGETLGALAAAAAGARITATGLVAVARG